MVIVKLPHMRQRFLIFFFLFFSVGPVAQAEELTFVLGGDVMLGRNVAKTLHPPEKVWGNLLSLLKNSDLTLINHEFAITNSNNKWNQTPKDFFFKAPPIAIAVLKSAGIDFVNLANNHVLDYQVKGLNDTISYLDKAGIQHAGAGMSQMDAESTALIKIKDVQIAIISFTNNMPEWEAKENTPGVFYKPINLASIQEVLEKIREAKTNVANLILVSTHWGRNWDKVPPDDFVRVAHALIDAGCDLIHGHSGHIIQGIELYKGKPIFYNMGDIIDDYDIKPNLRNDLAFIAKLNWDSSKNNFSKIEMIPTVITNKKTGLAKGSDADWVFETLTKSSKTWGTKIEKKNGVIEILN